MIEGRYIRASENDSAELNVSLAGPKRLHVSGLAIWGKTSARGPNIGQIEFEAPLEEGKEVVFTDDRNPNDVYRLKVRFTQGGAHVEERLAEGYFGLNVTFAGEYRRV